MMSRKRLREKVTHIPCELCRHAKDNGLVVYCEAKKEVVCDRRWINPVNCWLYCECVDCPFFEPVDEEAGEKYERLRRAVRGERG